MIFVPNVPFVATIPKKVISEGGQSLELYPVSFPEHVDPMVLAYASSARALFQPDLYTPPAAANGGPTAARLKNSIWTRLGNSSSIVWRSMLASFNHSPSGVLMRVMRNSS